MNHPVFIWYLVGVQFGHPPFDPFASKLQKVIAAQEMTLRNETELASERPSRFEVAVKAAVRIRLPVDQPGSERAR